MTPERFQQVRELFATALEREPAARGAYLQQACQRDRELLAEVEKLLRSHEKAEGFLAGQAPDARPNLQEREQGQGRVSPGTHLGPYEIVALLGAGGMGEVYRARDTRLGRDVAVKVLLRTFSKDPDRLRRFEQEARTAGALNHPNILVIYDVGTYNDSPYLVSELLEGETLRGRLAGGALPQRKAIDYAQQIARGLAAAQAKGIVHRDLKPENIFLLKDGRAKILDFGLAKLVQTEVSGAGETLPADAAARTAPGVVMGTMGYMSPEQAGGQPTDARSDIFVFGAILYEMLTGERAFRGASSLETLRAILNEEPPPLRDPGLDRVVRHCLEKTPEERFQSASDLAFDLEALATPRRPVATTTPRRRAWAVVLAAAILAAAALASFFAGRTIGGKGAASQVVFQQLTFRRGYLPSARFAPDGQTIVYSATWDGKPVEIFTTRLGSPESRPMGLPGAGVLSISSSGELAISMGCELNWGACQGTLARVPLAGGAPRQVLERVDDADWAPDGKSLAVVRAVEGRYRLEFPIGKVLYESPGWITNPRVSPKGDRIAFGEYPVLGNMVGSVSVVDLAGKKKTLLTGWFLLGLAWRPDGEEIWFTGTPVGRTKKLHAVSLSGDVRTIYRPHGDIAIADIFRDGRVLLVGDNVRSRIVGLTPGNGEERDLSWFDWSMVADLSADGKTLLFYEWGEGAGGAPHVYARKTDGSDAVRLGEGKPLALSPDGRWALALQQTSPPQLILLPTGAGEQKTLPLSGIQEYFFAFWFPDGKRISFVGSEAGHDPRSYVQDLEGGKARPVTAEGTYAFLISPDAKRMVIGAAGEYFLVPADGQRVPIVGLEAGDTPVLWSADGRALFVRGRGEFAAPVYRLDLSSGQRKLWKVLAPADPAGLTNIASDSGFRLTPDGRGYAFTYWSDLSVLYLAEGLK